MRDNIQKELEKIVTAYAKNMAEISNFIDFKKSERTKIKELEEIKQLESRLKSYKK